MFLGFIRNKWLNLKLRLFRFKRREKIISLGNKHADKTFYVISFDYDTQGLFAIVKSVLSHIMYALDKGWIPVVDLQNYKSQYQQVGVNAWELFFQQPCGYTLDDIKQAKHIVKSYYGLYPYDQFVFHVDILSDNNRLQPIASTYKQYIRPTSTVLQKMEAMLSALQIDSKTIGVLCRGTDYLNRKPHNHPRQPEPEIIISDVQKLLAGGEYDKVFVATEDLVVLDKFKIVFGEKLRFIDQPRLQLNDNQQYISDIKTSNQTKYQMAIDYYSALYVLSHCSAIIAGRTAGTLGAALMSDGFGYSHFYDLGSYD